MENNSNLIPCKVLLVDDEENILRALCRLLMEEEEVEVLTASSGEAGLKQLRQHEEVALIISDQRMPGLSGAEFLEQARQIAPDAVRIVLTGYADIGATMDAINKGGAARYLTKPWDDEAMLQAVREGVHMYRMVVENRRLHALVEKQNAELAEWNGKLKSRVLEQTGTIRRQNEKLSHQNQQITLAFRNSIVAFSRLIELHSPKLKDHTRNVTELSVNCAQSLNLSEAEIDTIRTAALLHDIGVIGIDPALAEKELSTMTDDERRSYQQHSVRGQTALDAVEELREAALLIRHHHERFDGAGFPDQLARKEIPLGARIIGFADYVDHELCGAHTAGAMQTVLNLIRKQSGWALDPELMEPMQPHILRLYGGGEPAAQAQEGGERELRPRELSEGMEITRNLYSGTGLLLITAGSILDRHKIDSIVRYYSIDPPSGGVFTRLAES